MYTSDIDAIYKNIDDNILTYDDVRIVSSTSTRTLQILYDFPNIEEVFCTLIFPIVNIETLVSLLLIRHKLKHLSFLVYMQQPINNKRKRLSGFDSLYEKCIKSDIPYLIRKLGDRLKYMALHIIVANTADYKHIYSIHTPYITITLCNGYFYTDCIGNLTINIFNASKSNLNGITTNGDIEYDLSDVSYIHEVTILSRLNSHADPINVRYLIQLVSKADIVNIIYNAETIEVRFLYSDILKCGTIGFFKRIKGMIPSIDAEEHIMRNGHLEEIHILVTSLDDIENVKYLVKQYQHRLIAYYIHCNQEYRQLIQDIRNADVIVCDVIHSLM